MLSRMSGLVTAMRRSVAMARRSSRVVSEASLSSMTRDSICAVSRLNVVWAILTPCALSSA